MNTYVHTYKQNIVAQCFSLSMKHDRHVPASSMATFFIFRTYSVVVINFNRKIFKIIQARGGQRGRPTKQSIGKCRSASISQAQKCRFLFIHTGVHNGS
jgi:hypothetical protein